VTNLSEWSLSETVYALDSTTIDLLSAAVSVGKFRRRKSAVKLHTLLDLQGSIPTNVYVTGGQVHDVNVLDVGLLETKLFCGPSAIPIPCGASTIAMPRRIPD